MLKILYKQLKNDLYIKLKYFIFFFEWRFKNPQNETFAVNFFEKKLVSVGRYTYGKLDIKCWNVEGEKLVIGNFVSIADGVKFILGGNHEINTFTTYPLKVMLLNESVEALTKGPIVIKDDVWIGMDSLILSGVTIGQGAIIGAGSVITKDVPPYAVVAGNPAKVIRYRYSQEIVEEMVTFDWNKIDLKKIKRLKNELYKPLTLDLVKELKKDFGEN